MATEWTSGACTIGWCTAGMMVLWTSGAATTECVTTGETRRATGAVWTTCLSILENKKIEIKYRNSSETSTIENTHDEEWLTATGCAATIGVWTIGEPTITPGAAAATAKTHEITNWKSKELFSVKYLTLRRWSVFYTHQFEHFEMRFFDFLEKNW